MVVSLEALGTSRWGGLESREVEWPSCDAAVCTSCVSEPVSVVPYWAGVGLGGECCPIPVGNGDAAIDLSQQVFILTKEVSDEWEELTLGCCAQLSNSLV